MASSTASTENTSRTEVDWEDLLDTLRAGKCLLFLGQGAFQLEGGHPLERAIADYLEADKPDHKYIRLYNADGFFIFRKNRYRRKLAAQLKDFYHQPFPKTEQLFSKIAQLPFPIICSLTPDNILARTFDAQGYDYASDFYFPNRPATPYHDPPSTDRPLIYNLLGNIEEQESILLTHSDFFSYLESVFKGNSMNPSLREEIEQAEHMLFLGLPYEKWYFQLLLRVLSINSDPLREIERTGLEEFSNQQLRTLYKEEFKIDFVPQGVEDFVDKLHERCREAGLLKQATALDESEEELRDLSLSGFQSLIEDAKTLLAMKYLKAYLQRRKPRSQQLLDSLLVLRNQYNLLRQREQRMTISMQDLTIENNQIVERLLQLINQAQEL